MELGEKLRSARLEAGLSQRQLCGEEITRNMLSQIEHGTARPSMDTLRLLAGRLGKPVSWFLDETAVTSVNLEVMTSARQLFDAGRYSQAVLALEGYREPDPVFDRERQLMGVLLSLAMAEQALAEGKMPYARELLERAKAGESSVTYCREELTRRRLLLQGKLPEGSQEPLPSLDAQLLLRAEAALQRGDGERSARFLEAAEDQTNPRWCLLRGEAYMAMQDYTAAAACFHNAEPAYREECMKKLEVCYRELGDYKRAYEYACRRK